MMPVARSIAHRVRDLEDTSVGDSFLAAITPEPVTIGKDWVQLEGLVLGTENFDLAEGRDLAVNDDGDAIDVVSAGRYFVSVNYQLVAATGDVWFECAVEPNGLSLAEWPTDLAQGHSGQHVPEAVFGWDDVEPGVEVGYVAPSFAIGATIAGWARAGSASGAETVDAYAILFATRITG